ncbi:MAG: hypothetical protein IPK83_01675 [Planctomycetes bacterium]|nr:hypothetical protein [Planctomycetota bacterium]
MALTGDDSLLIEVNGLTPGTSHDQWMIVGGVDLGGAALDTTGSTIIATPGQSVTIIDNDTSVDAVTGTFAGLSNGAAFLLNGQPFAVFYNGGDGNDVVLTRTNSLTPPATVYVEDDWAGTGNGVDPDGAGPASAFGFDAFDNIPDGVGAVAPGGTVIVYAGSYDDGGTVTTANIAILGPQAGVDPCSGRAGPEAVIDTANGDTEGAFVIQADGCTIDGFTIQNVNVAINVSLAGSPPVGGYNGLTARNCIIEHAAIDGVNLNYHGNSAPALVEANLIIDVGTSGITAGDDRGTPGVGDDIVTQATIRGNMVINAVFGITGYQTGSSILGNIVAVDAGFDGAAAASGGVGISGQLASTVIRANKVHGYDNVGGPYSTGIGFATYPNRPESTGVTIRQNSVYGNLIGIGVAHTSGTSIGIVASPGNLIYGNLGAGMVNTTTSLINATNNYWGDASGPLDPVGSSEVPPCNGDATLDLNADGAGNQVSDASFPAAGCSNIDYCPWSSGSGTIAMEAADTCIGIGQTQIVVEVWSRSVSQSLTGWQAFVNYDTSRLTFNVAASAYSAAPFGSHFRTLGPAGDVEISSGLLGLDGNVGIGGTPDAGGDDLLATLVFDVVPAGWNECDQTLPVFTNFMTFYSELSLNGVAIPTALVDAPCFSRDTVAPSITCDITESSPISVDSNCEAVFTYSALVTDNCGIDTADVSRTVLVTTANASVLAPGRDDHAGRCLHRVSERLRNGLRPDRLPRNR